MSVSTTSELNNAIVCFNSQTIKGVYTISLSADITLNVATTDINNPISGVALQIIGNDKVLDGNKNYRVLSLAANTHLSIDHLTIRHGNAAQTGGGIYNSGTLTMSNSTLTGNTAEFYGGGIYNYGILTIMSSTLSSNSTPYYGGAISNKGTLTLDSSVLISNSAQYCGGIYNEGTLTLNNSVISSNSAKFNGGGINNSGSGTLWVSGSQFLSNSSADGLGGGINNDGTLTVSESMFSGNSAGNSGGGLYNAGTGTLTISNSTITSNSASYSAGGIWNNGKLTVSDTTFTKNSAKTVGGGIYNATSLTVSNSTFSNNSAVQGGGGIYNDGTLSVSTSTFDGNSGGYGGGIDNRGNLQVISSMLSNNSVKYEGGGINSRRGSLKVSNSTLSGNSAQQWGGGISNDGGVASGNISLSVINVTFSGNSARVGGGLYNVYSSITIRNTIIANSPQGGDCYTDRITSQTHNLIEDTSSACTISNGVQGSIIGHDPLLGPLQNNGGGTATHALLVGSPAINVGDNTTCMAAPISNQDQRGKSRPQGSICDIGAYEYISGIEVSGQGHLIANSDSTADSQDGTDLGTIVIGSGLSRQYSISNKGAADLAVASITLSGVHVSDFGVSDLNTPITISPNSTVSFTLTFTPSARGLQTATVNIANSNLDQTPYTFTVQAGGLAQYQVITGTDGNGHGMVNLNPAGGTYIEGSEVIINAVADTGSHFAGWSGDCTGTGNCAVTVDDNKRVTATFALNSYAIITATEGNGKGKVSLNPATGNYNYGTVVTVTASADTGSHFAGWSGDCTGTNACRLTVDSSKQVTATFAQLSSGLAVGLIRNTPDPIRPGDTITWEVVLTNTGEITLTIETISATHTSLVHVNNVTAEGAVEGMCTTPFALGIGDVARCTLLDQISEVAGSQIDFQVGIVGKSMGTNLPVSKSITSQIEVAPSGEHQIYLPLIRQ